MPDCHGPAALAMTRRGSRAFISTGTKAPFTAVSLRGAKRRGNPVLLAAPVASPDMLSKMAGGATPPLRETTSSDPPAAGHLPQRGRLWISANATPMRWNQWRMAFRRSSHADGPPMIDGRPGWSVRAAANGRRHCLPKGAVQGHHHREAQGKHQRAQVGVGPGGGLRDQLLHHHVDHGPGGEGQHVGQRRDNEGGQPDG